MKTTHRIGAVAALAFLGLGLASPVLAVGLYLKHATATYTQNPGSGRWDPDNTIDGDLFGKFSSWAIDRPSGPQAETIVWESGTSWTRPPRPLVFRLIFWEDAVGPANNLGRFRLSYTFDDRSTFADGRKVGGDVDADWVVVNPVKTRSNDGETMTTLTDSSILVSGGSNERSVYTVVSRRMDFTDITGFRLEAMKDPSLPFGGPGRDPSSGNFHLSEFRVLVPEPASALLAAFGLAGLAGWRRMRARRST